MARKPVLTPPQSETTTPPAIDSSFLEGLVGYNTRRASLVIMEHFLQRMAPHRLRAVDFSVLSLIHHNPGITSRQLCAQLGVLPPNLVALVGALLERGLIERKPHHNDGRAMSLFLTEPGTVLVREAEATAVRLEEEATARLSAAERRTLMQLLQKIYR